MAQQSTISNPFVGLRPYQNSDSMYYFGRNEQIKTLLRLLHQHRFVAVVGSSGAGKSSLIRAGLVPQLEAGFLVHERDQWFVATAKPGDAPLQNLVGSLLEWTEAGDNQTLVSERLEQLTIDIEENGTQALLDALEPQLLNTDHNLFILIDQFEELFRFGLDRGATANRQQAEQFVALLLSLSRQDLPIYVCLTMRSDFLGDCDAFYGLPEAINKSQFLVPRLTRGQRQEVISNPINLAGAKIAPRLVDKLLNESIDTRDDLPILQHALMRTWDVWQDSGGDGVLDIEHYEKAHTIHQALDCHADEALEELDDEQKHIAKVLFQALTTVDAGNRKIRRPAHLQEVAEIASVTPDAVMKVIDCFCEQNRSFLVLSSPVIEDNPLIDISHESLIRQWKQLSVWVDEEKEAAEIYLRLTTSSQRYKDQKAGLLYEIELEQALEWRRELPVENGALVWAKRYCVDLDGTLEFLRLSELMHEQKLLEKVKEQKQHAKFLKDKADLEEQRRLLAEKKVREQQKKWFLVVMALLTVIMLMTVGYSVKESRQLLMANKKTEQALIEAKLANIKAEKASAEASYNLAKAFEEKSLSAVEKGKYEEALLYALEAQKNGKLGGKSVLLPSSLSKVSSIPESAIQTYLYRTPSIGSANMILSSVVSVAYSPDGAMLASTAVEYNSLKLWNAQTGHFIRSLDLSGISGDDSDTESVSNVAFSPDGNSLALALSDKSVVLLDIKSGKIIKTFRGHSGDIYALVFSPDGKVIASGSSDNTIRLWSVQSGAPIRVLKGHSGTVAVLTYSPNGKVIASGSVDETIRLWGTISGEEQGVFRGHSGLVNSLVYTPDGQTLISGSSDRSIKLWSVGSGGMSNTLKGHKGAISALAISPNGKNIVSASKDKAIKLWELHTGKIIKSTEGLPRPAYSLAFNPDGKSFASRSDEHYIRFWESKSLEPLNSPEGHSEVITSLRYSSDGNFFASSSRDRTVQLWSADTGKWLRTFEGSSGDVLTIDISPQGENIASGSEDNTIRVWNIKQGRLIKNFRGHTGPVNELIYSPDGKVIASGSNDGTIRFWDTESGLVLKVLNNNSSQVRALAFSPDGKSIVSGGWDGSIRLWDVEDGVVTHILGEDSGPVNALAYSPDGKIIASGARDGLVKLWDAHSGEAIGILDGVDKLNGGVGELSYNPSGRVIAVTSLMGGVIKFWDTRTRKLINSISDAKNPISYSPDGKTIISGAWDNSIRVWSTVVTSKEKNTLVGREDTLHSLAYNPDGKSIASSSYDNTIKLWDIKTGDVSKVLVGHLDRVTTLAYSPSEKLIASASADKSIRLWSLETGESIKVLKGASTIASLAYSPDGKVIASAESEGSIVKLWDVQSGKVINTFEEKSSPIYSLAYSPNGKLLASGSKSGVIRLWNVESGEVLSTLRGHSGAIITLAFTPDSKMLASGAFDQTVRLWGVESGKVINTLTGHSGIVSTVAFSPNGKILATGSLDKKISFWDALSGKSVKNSIGQSDVILAFSFSPDGSVIASGEGETIKFYNLNSDLYRLIYEFNAADVSGALRFLWELDLKDLNFEYSPRAKSLISDDGFNIAWTNESRKYRSLLNMPKEGESKMTQVVRWLEERCAYKEPEKYGCTPTRLKEEAVAE